MKPILLVYVHVPHDLQHEEHARKFLESYANFPPDYPHETCIICQGGYPVHGLREAFIAALPSCTFYIHDDSGWDIGAYIALSKSILDLGHEFAIYCGGSTFFRKAGWLKRIAEHWQTSGPGVYGANATYEVSPHLNTSGFWCKPELLACYPITVSTKEQRYEFEHGPRAFWKLENANGVSVKLVTWQCDYIWQSWRKAVHIFRRGNQSNCLIYFHHHLKYETASIREKTNFAIAADFLTDPLWKALLRHSPKSINLPAMLSASRAHFLNCHKFRQSFPVRNKSARSKTITIVGITSVAPKSHELAIELTAKCMPMKCQKLLITPEHVIGFDGRQERLPLGTGFGMNGSTSFTIRDWCNFALYELHQFIETDFALFVQWDGYAINPGRWDDAFLSYDYIGAPWTKQLMRISVPEKLHRFRVGNGGFSLRSKRWLETSAKLPQAIMNEDFYASCVCRRFFETKGCRVAPIELAMRWSFEHPIEENRSWNLSDSFGFHGLTDIDPARAHLRLDPKQ